MRHLVAIVFVLVAAAPAALADIPSSNPIGKRWLPFTIAVAVAIGAALFAYARFTRRRAADARAATADRSKDA